MSVEITWERQHGVAVAILEGSIDGSGAGELQGMLESGLDVEGDRAVILDFEQVSYINSSGLRVCLKIAKECRKSGRKFGLCNLTDATQEIIAVSGFDQIIPVFDSRTSAVGEISAE